MDNEAAFLSTKRRPFAPGRGLKGVRQRLAGEGYVW
jgi:hypothetical protein